MKQLLAVFSILALFVMASCDGVTSVNEDDLTGDDTPSPELAFSEQGNTPLPQFAGTGNYYEALTSDGITWREARDASAAMGTYRGCVPHLVTITSQEENDFIVENFEDAWPQGYWLGGYQPDGNPDFDEYRDQGWTWVTGEPFVFTSWAFQEPNDAPYDELVLHFSGPYPNPPGIPWEEWKATNEGTWNDLVDLEMGSPIPEDKPGYVVEWSCDKEVSKVTGSAHLYPDGENYRTFSFTAIGNVDGSAKGQWQLYNRRNAAGLHGTVECVVVDGNKAWFAGPITHALDPNRIGDIKGFLVVDNGESGLPDRTSGLKSIPFPSSDPVITSAQGWCAYRLALNPLEIENGNIQIH